jgi:hypothetical protein
LPFEKRIFCINQQIGDDDVCSDDFNLSSFCISGCALSRKSMRCSCIIIAVVDWTFPVLVDFVFVLLLSVVSFGFVLLLSFICLFCLCTIVVLYFFCLCTVVISCLYHLYCCYQFCLCTVIVMSVFVVLFWFTCPCTNWFGFCVCILSLSLYYCYLLFRLTLCCCTIVFFCFVWLCTFVITILQQYRVHRNRR